MKQIIIILTIIFTNHASADFFQAQNDFENKKYVAAFQEYLHLSKLGNRQAQYNLALMYFSGLGTDQSLSSAYAWSRIVEKDHPDFKKLNDLIASKISESEKIKSNQIKKTLDKFIYSNIKSKYGPEKLETSPEYSEKIYFKRTGKSKSKPEYPREVIDEGARGWAEVLYNIYPDGTVRNLYIKNQYPHTSFGPPSIEFMARQNYKFYKNKKPTTISNPRFSIQRIQFGIKGISGLLSKEQKSYLNELMKSALSGSVESQYKYIKYYNTVLNRSSSVSSHIIANWMFQAAQYGIVDAQFMMGYTLYYGNGIKKDIAKGLKWLTEAAIAGHAHANYYLYQILAFENIENPTGHDADYWLFKAAELDFTIAKFITAKKLVNDQKELDLAQKYLDLYKQEIGQTIDWYLYQSKVYFLTNNELLKKTFNKGRKLAKKHGWPMQEWEEFDI